VYAIFYPSGFGIATISSTTLYLVLIDILKDMGHEVSHIQAEYVREGISRALHITFKTDRLPDTHKYRLWYYVDFT
jgi:hypothetical protein